MKKYNLNIVLFFICITQLLFAQGSPIANDDTNTTFINTALNEVAPGVLANDTDANGNTLTVLEFLVNGTTFSAGETVKITEGSFTLNADGSYVFTPELDYLGNVPQFNYTISDGTFTSSANLYISVFLPPEPPVANDDINSTEVNTTLNKPAPGVLANDTDGNGDTLTVLEFQINGTTFSAGEKAIISAGEITLNSNGSYIFSPTFNFIGSLPTIIYKVSDGVLVSSANLLIDVFIPPKPPKANTDYDTIEINTTLSVPAPGVLANDTDINQDTLNVTEFVVNGNTYSASQTAVLSEGRLTINKDGSYIFVPSPNYIGDVPDVTYTISDGSFFSQASLLFTVEKVDDLLSVDSYSSCNQGFTASGAYKIRYTLVLKNTSTARDYHPTSLIRNIDFTDNLQQTFGNGCVIEVSEVNVVNNVFTRDFINGGGYPREFNNNSVNNDFLNVNSTSIFNSSAINTLILYPRQNVTISYCVTVNPFCDGRPNPTPSGSGIDFENFINITSDRGTVADSVLLTDFHTTEAIVSAGLFIPEFNDSLDPPGTINFDGTYDYTNRVIITNEGTVTANNVNFNMGLGSFLDNGITFTELRINQASGPTVTINQNYNGETETLLLAPNNTLAAGEKIILELFYIIGPYSSTSYSYFNQNDKSQTQGTADGFDDTTNENRRENSFVIWSDNLGNHLDRYYKTSSPTLGVSSSLQCDCQRSSMRFLFSSSTSTNKVVSSKNTIPNGILEHEEITYQITLENTSESVQLTNLQLVDDLTNSCGGNIIALKAPFIVSSTANSNPTLNANFNGVLDTNIFTGSDGVIRVGETITVQFSVLYTEACIGLNSATFIARNPLNSGVRSSSSVQVNASTDSDDDGIVNSIDIDDDNDTIPDVEEYNGLNPLDDDDADLIPNYRDTDFGTDANADGIVDLFDFDNDGVANHLDLDSDNDGILDIFEAGKASTDTNNNGRTNNLVGANGLDNTLENNDTQNAIINYSILNTDTDSNPNYLDIDSDADGIVDNIEAQLTSNYITASRTVSVTGIDIAYVIGLSPIDNDNDGIFDYIDLNSDNDIRDDIIEAWDIDSDGVVETRPTNLDIDNDGLDDAFDTDTNSVNPTNGQTPNSFPNSDNSDTLERDWREIIAVFVLIDDISETEGDDFTFTLTLVAKNDNSFLLESTTPVVINLSSADGNITATQYDLAVAPFDYISVVNQTLTIPAFTSSIQFTVSSLEDSISELSEFFTLNGNIISNNTINTTLSAVGSIVDNDDLPTISMNNSLEVEGENLEHRINISNPSSTPIVIEVSTVDDLATSPNDYNSISESLTIEGTINPNNPNTEISFNISTNLDNINELNEENLNVIGVVTSNNVGVQDLSKSGIIIDANPNPLIIINDDKIEEGEILNFTIRLVNANGEDMQNHLPINIILETIDDTTFANEDYQSISILTTIPAFTSSISQSITTIDDRLNEDEEKLFLQITTNLDNVSNTSAPRGIGVITDNDYPNLFSPNGDGLSDVFKISGIVEDYPNFKLIIFNRLGNQVYKYSNNGNTNPVWWDGTNNGKPVSTGVYYYTLDFNDGVTKPRTNFIQLIR